MLHMYERFIKFLGAIKLPCFDFQLQLVAERQRLKTAPTLPTLELQPLELVLTRSAKSMTTFVRCDMLTSNTTLCFKDSYIKCALVEAGFWFVHNFWAFYNQHCWSRRTLWTGFPGHWKSWWQADEHCWSMSDWCLLCCRWFENTRALWHFNRGS